MPYIDNRLTVHIGSMHRVQGLITPAIELVTNICRLLLEKPSNVFLLTTNKQTSVSEEPTEHMISTVASMVCTGSLLPLSGTTIIVQASLTNKSRL